MTQEREPLRGASMTRCSTRCPGVEVISSLELEATPPFDYAHDHFGYRDRLSQPVIEGTEDIPYTGCGGPLKAGEFILGYPDESGQPYPMPEPKSCRGTAATWRIAGWRSMSASSAISSPSMARRRRSRS